MPNLICLLSSHEAELLRADNTPDHKSLNHSRHRHVTRAEARLMTLGTQYVAHLDPNYRATGETSERFKPTAEWAILNGGQASSQHLVIIESRRWQARGGVMQWLPIGTTKQQRKRSRTHLRMRAEYSQTQCRDTNEKQRNV